MPSPDPTPSPIHARTWAWAVLIALTLVSVTAAHTSQSPLGRLIATTLVAGVAWTKGLIVIHSFLESRLAGRMFHRIVLGFSVLAPLALIASGAREFLRAV